MVGRQSLMTGFAPEVSRGSTVSSSSGSISAAAGDFPPEPATGSHGSDPVLSGGSFWAARIREAVEQKRDADAAVEAAALAWANHLDVLEKTRQS
jgi:hypothetical protein